MFLASKLHTKPGIFDGLIKRLEGRYTPEHLLVKPVDAWPGSHEKGCDIAAHGAVLEPESWPASWHHFSFLRDLRMMGAEGRMLGQSIMASWLQSYMLSKAGKDVRVFTDGVMGQRLYHWLAHYEFFMAEADEDLHDAFFESLYEQSRFLWVYASKKQGRKNQGYGYVQAIKGAIISALCLDADGQDINGFLDVFSAAVDGQILSDGSHISRAPYKLLYVLKSVLEVRTTLIAAGRDVPRDFDDKMAAMVRAIRTLRHNDGGFVTFQGAQEGDADAIDCIIAQSGLRVKAVKSLPDGGFERVSLGRTSLFFDGGNIPPAPYDQMVHASPLAFEMSYGRERFFVSCSCSKDDMRWADVMRRSPAHTMAVMDDEDALPAQGKAKDYHCTLDVQEAEKAVLIDGRHNGYMGQNGYNHSRRVYLCSQGLDLRGEDHFSAQNPQRDSNHLTLRFHLHPRVIVSLVRDGTEALLRLPSGMGWRFHHDGGALALEESLYFGGGDIPRKTSQLVIHGRVENGYGLIKWALQAEGLSRQNKAFKTDKADHGEAPNFL